MKTYAIKVGGSWFIARLVSSKKFGRTKGLTPRVWMHPTEHFLICNSGAQEKTVA